MQLLAIQASSAPSPEKKLFLSELLLEKIEQKREATRDRTFLQPFSV
jgi:hypothetical protein